MINETQREIILQKCQEREEAGYQTLHDSDIHDIMEECQRRGVPLSRKELDALFSDINCAYCDPDSDECEYFVDADGTPYREVEESTWDEYSDGYLIKRERGVRYCQYCGRRLI